MLAEHLSVERERALAVAKRRLNFLARLPDYICLCLYATAALPGRSAASVIRFDCIFVDLHLI